MIILHLELYLKYTYNNLRSIIKTIHIITNIWILIWSYIIISIIELFLHSSVINSCCKNYYEGSYNIETKLYNIENMLFSKKGTILGINMI